MYVASSKELIVANINFVTRNLNSFLNGIYMKRNILLYKSSALVISIETYPSNSVQELNASITNREYYVGRIPRFFGCFL